MSSATKEKAAKARKPTRSFKVVKPKKNTKRTTESHRNHRFQSFNERISKLKIDPIRRKRHVDEHETAEKTTHTYFGESLQQWRDTNLSATFSAFAREMAPLCDNLPVVLHNEDRIVDLLVTYIEKGDALAMEPLLSLLSHLARDLDTRFEKHFQKAVAAVASVAARHEDFAVIEWSFTCLAWLFKYLSRLLVPDLRPLYDLMAPYLGKEKQKPFIVRFAAESLSFLVRKAAAVYERDSDLLGKIIKHMLEDCKVTAASNIADLLPQGIMTLLTEAIRGVQYGVHSGACAILHSVFTQAGDMAQEAYDAMETVTCGSLTSLIHHSNVEGFAPVVDTMTAYIEKTVDGPVNSAKIRFCSALLFTTVSVRKGSRISNWKAVVAVVQKLIAKCDELSLNDELAEAVLSLLAIASQTATIDAVLATRHTLESLRVGRWAPYFLRFCDMFARLGHARFHDFVLPQFQKFIIEKSEKGDAELLSLLPRLGSADADHKIKNARAFSEETLKVIESLILGNDAALTRANMLLAATPYFVLDRSQSKRLRDALHTLVESSLGDAGNSTRKLRYFSLGPAFQQLLELEIEPDSMRHLWPWLCSASSESVSLPQFWSNVLRFLKFIKPTDNCETAASELEDSLIRCLSTPSHSIRSDALDILQELYRLNGVEVPSILSTAITIESIPISLETARSISMNIRRLASEYSTLKEGDLMQRAIPTFCFGLLHSSLSQAWDYAASTIESICQSKAGEEIVINLAQTWIDGKAMPEDKAETPAVIDVNTEGFKVFSDFECPNLAKIAAIRAQVFEEENGGLPSPTDHLALILKQIPLISSTARSQALKILHKIPHVAEKRSRLLVPILLQWAGSSTGEGGESSDADRWARKDQKALLAVFAQFVNPTVLYRSTKVFEALLALCANGDVEIQKSALQAVLAWKNKSVTRYQEHLMNLLDEARFREELSVFLQDAADDEDEVGIRSEDHPDLMPVLLRLLYGRAISGGKEGQSGRRKAIFVALSRFGEGSLKEFLDIAFKGMHSNIVNRQNLPEVQAPVRQQLGLVNMMNDMLQVLGSELQSFAERLLDGILACTVGAARILASGESEAQSLLRTVRQTGIQCLVKIFSSMEISDATYHGQAILTELIQPRLDSFASENAQSVSGILRLLSAWSEHRATARNFEDNGATILQSVAELLQNQHTKGEVQRFILQDIVDNLAKVEIDPSVLQPHVSSFVRAVGAVIDQQPPKDVLDACVHSFSQLSSRITSSEEAIHVTKACTDLLTKPNKAVSPVTKAGLLQTILPLIETFGVDAVDELYSVLCGLYSRLAHAPSRVLLSKVVKTLVRQDMKLLEVADICEDLSAMGTKLDEPDHERRERAFAKIYESKSSFSLQQWLPIVHNLLFYIRDSEDRFNRTSASHGLQLYVGAAARRNNEIEWLALLESSIITGIERGMQEKSELVRAEFLLVLNQIVEKFPAWQKVSGMQTLVVGGDEEASFFTNVLHIQQHRRLRALRRLADNAATVGSSNASKLFLPLIEHFVFDAMEGDAGLTLSNEAVQTIGALAKTLNKSAFRATFQRYIGYLKNKDKEELEKVVLRLLGAMVDNIHSSPGDDAIGAVQKPSQVSEAIIKEQLPPLLEYLHQKDESTVDRRMPIAVTIVKLMSNLSPEDFAARLPAVLTDVSHVLRSRSQEARDQTRKALAAISRLIGAHYFGFILKELRGSLKRGYQLHVLSYTVHSLLVDPQFAPGDLDECLPELMDVVMDDIFGVTGQEKDAEEYKSGMKEIKSSKSYDTMELLARVTPIRRLGALIRPIRNMLSENLDTKSIKKIDELLTRLRKGLDLNPESESREMLSFCWEVVNQVCAENQAPMAKVKAVDENRKRYLVQPEPEKQKRQPKGSTTSYRFKLISFALNLLRKVIRRHEDLQTPTNMAGFLPMAGDALVQGQEEVKLSAVRLLSTIMRVPMKQLEDNALVYVREAVSMIKGAVSSTTDASKAALELVTSVLREKRSVEIQEKDIALLLKRLKNDIDEPDRQGIVYKFLRAILGRKIVITEVYEVMDEVGKTMVSNPDRSIRESARSAYLQFVMDFPQGKDRWEKQTAFLVGNLRYEHAAGRQSVMEFLHQLLNKFGDDVITERAPKIFLNLVPILVADSDNACRDMARILVGKIFERAEDEKLMKHLLTSVDNWMKSNKALLRCGALQCWTVLLRTKELPQKQVDGLRGQLADIVNDEIGEQEIMEPGVLFDALQTFSVLVETMPSVAFSASSADIWKGMQQLPSTDDARVQEIIATLLGAYFTDFASTSSKTTEGLAGVPLRGSGGLELGAESMRDLCRVSLRALRGITLSTSEPLTGQIIRNLVFLGRCFSASEMPWNESTTQNHADEDEDEEEEDNNSNGEGENPTPLTNETALSHLLRRLSSMLLSPKFYLISRTSSLQTLTLLLPHLSPTSIPNLQPLLRPLYSLTDPTVPKSTGEKVLTEKAQELLELLQKKSGSEVYLKALAETRKGAKGRREERKKKRRIEAVVEPERWVERKQRKYENKKVKLKEKGAEARGKRRGW